MTELLSALWGAKIYDLAHPYFVGMPHYPTHPPFLFSLTKKHGDFVAPGGVSSAADALGMSGHLGTHIDALCHFSRGGKLHGAEEASEIQSYGGGLARLSVDTIAPILKRGILLDIAGLFGPEPLPADFEIATEHMESAAAKAGVEVQPDDIVLLRTGWARYFEEPARFLSEGRGPGPAEEGGRWLSSRRIFAAGSDTISFERVPNPSMPVHVHLLVDSGIHIMECLNLEQLAAARASVFLFVALPLKFRGATGSPIRPIAIVK